MTLHRFRRYQQSLHEGPISLAAHQSDRGFHFRLRFSFLPGCIFRISRDIHVQEDEEKTPFITPRGTYYFIRMEFGLKSVGSTFARAVQIGFEPQLHRNIEAYMDDIVVKTKDRATLIQDLEETFTNLC